jgi:hypothetical protein
MPTKAHEFTDSEKEYNRKYYISKGRAQVSQDLGIGTYHVYLEAKRQGLTKPKVKKNNAKRFPVWMRSEYFPDYQETVAGVGGVK